MRRLEYGFARIGDSKKVMARQMFDALGLSQARPHDGRHNVMGVIKLCVDFGASSMGQDSMC